LLKIDAQDRVQRRLSGVQAIDVLGRKYQHARSDLDSLMTHFLLTIPKGLAPQALHDTALAVIQQHYYDKVGAADEYRLIYVVGQAGGVWYDKQYREQGSDPLWYRHPATNYDTAGQKAAQDIALAFLPRDHRDRLRYVSEPDAILNVVRESLLGQIAYLLTQPTNSYDPESLELHWAKFGTCVQRLEAFPLLAQSTGHYFPFSPTLQASEIYPAYDLSASQAIGPTSEYAIARTA
jgi:hypothetical protein